MQWQSYRHRNNRTIVTSVTMPTHVHAIQYEYSHETGRAAHHGWDAAREQVVTQVQRPAIILNVSNDIRRQAHTKHQQ
jgi:hypothetical protein